MTTRVRVYSEWRSGLSLKAPGMNEPDWSLLLSVIDPVPKTSSTNKSRKGEKSAWKTHGGALFDHLSKRALTSLKSQLGLNTEDKFVDTAGTTTATTTLTSRIASPTIPQGLTASTRSGSSIRITKAQLRINIQSGDAALPVLVRVIVTRFRQPSAPATSAILQTTTDFSSHLNHHFTANGLELLMDKVYTVGSKTSDTGSIYINKTFTNPNWHMIWADSDTTGVPADLLEGAIYVHWYADQTAFPPIFNSTMRMTYVDN